MCISGNTVGNVLRFCTDHASGSSSSRDFPARQEVYLLLPTRVTPAPEYSFASTPTGSRITRPDNTRLPRRRRTVRNMEDPTFTIDAMRDATPRAQDFRDVYDDFDYADNSMNDLTVVQALRERVSVRLRADEDADNDGDDGSLSHWLSIHTDRASQPPRDQPRSPSVLSTGSDDGSGEPLFPFPRAMGRPRAVPIVSSNGDLSWSVTGPEMGSSPSNVTAQRDRNNASGSRPGSSSSLFEELAAMRRQQPRSLAQSLPSASYAPPPPPTVFGPRRRQRVAVSLSAEDSPVNMTSPALNSATRTTIRELVNRTPPLPYPHFRQLPRPTSLEASAEPTHSDNDEVTRSIDGILAAAGSFPMARRRSRRPEGVPPEYFPPQPPVRLTPYSRADVDAMLRDQVEDSGVSVPEPPIAERITVDWTIPEEHIVAWPPVEEPSNERIEFNALPIVESGSSVSDSRATVDEPAPSSFDCDADVA